MSLRVGLLRDRAAGHARVGYAELLFDLVFVYAVTQIAHGLLGDLSLLGLARTLVLFLGVWWVWVYTAWVTNWLDPDRPGVRLLLFALMALGLVLSISLPHAFEGDGLAFALAYVGMQVGRSIYTWVALRRTSPDNSMNFARITAWLVLSGAFWIAGGLADLSLRLPLWALAILLEYASPLLSFRVPGLGRSDTATWDVSTHHLAERCGLFIIIVLGESILILGNTYAHAVHDLATSAAVAVALPSTLAIWWLYFAGAAERAGERFEAAADVGAMARSAYTFLHVPIVGGIIAFAAGVEVLIAHPLGHAGVAAIALLVGGPLVCLLGLMAFRRATGLAVWTPHWLAVAALVLMIGLSHLTSPLTLAALVATTLIALAAVEGRRRQS